ncbi:MAG: FkbM family methyltransferase [Chitinophagaceae bacterium]
MKDNFIRRVYKKLQFLLINPYKGVINASEYKRIRRMKRYTQGESILFNKKILFTDNYGYLNVVKEQFVENQNDFVVSNKQPFIIDCGANIGLSTLFFKRKYPDAKIIAFEPDPDIFEILKKNVASFELNNVELRNEAVWIEDTTLKFYSDTSLAGSIEWDALKSNNVLNVPAKRLKSIIAGKKVDFLKIDIEGAENSLMFDLEGELKNVGLLFLEYHSINGKEDQLPGILKLISDAGFKYYIKNGFDYCAHPFLDKKLESFNFCLNVFCYREINSVQ